MTGSYVDITLSAAEIAAIMETLPDDLSDTRKEVVLTAYSLFGKVKYFWGGKSLVRGWDSRWGKAVSDILGHSTVQLTMDLYCHASVELKREAVNMMADLW